jgi:hypothetical protein
VLVNYGVSLDAVVTGINGDGYVHLARADCCAALLTSR